MTWTPRQRAMLEEMGLRLWAPAAEPGVEPGSAKAPEEVRQPAAAQAGKERTISGRGPSIAARPPVLTRSEIRLGERPHGIATMDWPALRDAVASCTACGLCRGRTNTVFGSGNLRARWMIVGEAPGEQEDLRGDPFVGKSGQLLDNMLRSLQLTRDEGSPARQVYIANTLKCRPPGNRNPEPGELAQCEPFLIRQIELVEPGVILAMGRFAVQALLRSSEPVGRLRGRVHRYHDVPLVVTYHPAYLLRNPLDKARAWDDLCLALDLAQRGEAP